MDVDGARAALKRARQGRADAELDPHAGHAGEQRRPGGKADNRVVLLPLAFFVGALGRSRPVIVEVIVAVVAGVQVPMRHGPDVAGVHVRNVVAGDQRADTDAHTDDRQ